VARIYLDHHATTPVDPAVVAEMLPFFSELFGNPSSRMHGFGQEAHAAVESARAEVAALVSASPEEIVFTSGATESDNLAIRGVAGAIGERGRHVVTTEIEHPAVLEPCRSLERRGFEVTRVGVGPDGLVPAAAVLAALRPDTVLSPSWPQQRSGDAAARGGGRRACKERGILFQATRYRPWAGSQSTSRSGT
jgi:cysteine desulfurase